MVNAGHVTIPVDLGGEKLIVSYRFGMNQLERLDIERRYTAAQDELDAAGRELDALKARLKRDHERLLDALDGGTDDEVAECEARCAALTERVKAAQARVEEAGRRGLDLQNELFCSMVVDWDVTEDGQKVPVTPDAVARLPMEVVRRILDAVRADQGEGRGVRSGNGSRKRAS